MGGNSSKRKSQDRYKDTGFIVGNKNSVGTSRATTSSGNSGTTDSSITSGRVPQLPVPNPSAPPLFNGTSFFVSPVAKKISSSGNQNANAPHLQSEGPRTLSNEEEIDMVIAVAVKLYKVAAGPGANTVKVEDLAKLLNATAKQLLTICQRYPGLVCHDDRKSSMETAIPEKHLICYNYNCNSCRQDRLCERVHVCCKWLYGKCTDVECEFEHVIVGNLRNTRHLAKYGIHDWSDGKLKLLLLGLEQQISPVCKFYNSPSGCNKRENCSFFHICKKFVEKVCTKNCGRNHLIYSCENRRSILSKASARRFDEAGQLRSRLHLKLNNIPSFAALESLIPSAGDVKLTGGWRSGPPGKMYAWYFLDERGVKKLQGLGVAGVSFGLHVSKILEEAFANGEKNLVLKIGPHTYAYDLNAMEQKNVQTLVKRQLKRNLIFIRNDLPQVPAVPQPWMPMIDVGSGGDQAVAFPLSREDEEFRTVHSLFYESGGIPGSRIFEIYRIQNPTKKRIYDTQKRELMKIYKSARAFVEEMRLFHGTDPSAIRGISEGNFDWRHCGESVGTRYGKGTYFGRSANISHGYTTAGSDGTRFMFVAFVLVGLKCRGNPDMKYPPVWREPVKFDTSVDDIQNPRIFVKFESNHCYPAYLVQYAA